jgi:hypothetical protein
VNKDKVLVHGKQINTRGVAETQKQVRQNHGKSLEKYLLELAMGYGHLETKVVNRIVRSN